MGKRSRGGSTIRLRGAAAQRFVELLSANTGSPIRSCRFCGCDDTHACKGGCSWTGATLCSACTPSAEETVAALCLVGDTEHITDEQVASWTPDQRADAFHWAMALHHHASDNPDVSVPPRPSFTLPPEVRHG